MRIIAGTYKSRTLIAPRGDKTRPTTDRARESLFNVLTNRIAFEGIRVLDLFAGSGALAFEAMSRGAGEAVLVERDRSAMQAAKENARSLEIPASRIHFVNDDVYRFLDRSICQEDGTRNVFDLVFADAPYDDPKMNNIAELVITNGWVVEHGLCVIEHRSSDAIAAPPNTIVARELKAGEAAFTILTHNPAETSTPR